MYFNLEQHYLNQVNLILGSGNGRILDYRGSHTFVKIIFLCPLKLIKGKIWDPSNSKSLNIFRFVVLFTSGCSHINVLPLSILEEMPTSDLNPNL